MILGLDIKENKGLFYGCIFSDGTLKINQTFNNPKEMWKYIINIYLQECKYKRNLQIYCFDHKNKINKYADILNAGLDFRAFNPFIVEKKFTINEKKKYALDLSNKNKISLFGTPGRAISKPSVVRISGTKHTTQNWKSLPTQNQNITII
jgi:hypothetical protein